MQYKKNEIKNRILIAAKTEFLQKGYADASISIIAKNAFVPIGSIYRYFENKMSLLDAILEKVCENLPKIVDAIYEEYDKCKMEQNGTQLAEVIAQKITIFYNANVGEINLLLSCGVTKYEKYIDTYIDFVAKVVKDKLLKDNKESDGLLSNIIARGFIQGLIMLEKEAADNEKTDALVRFVSFYFHQAKHRV